MEYFKKVIDKIIAILMGLIVNLITPEKSIKSSLIVVAVMIICIIVGYYIFHRWPRIFGVKTAYAATGIVFNEDHDRVLLSYHKNQKRWVPPGGHIKNTELLHEKVIELIKKESGYTTKFCNFHDDSEFDNICTIVPQPFRVQIEKQEPSEGHDDHYDFLYILFAEPTQDNKHSLDSKWYSLDEIENMVGKRETYSDVLEIAKVALKILNKLNKDDEDK